MRDFESLLVKHGLADLAAGEPRLLALLQELTASIERHDDAEKFKAVINAIPGYVSWLSSDLRYLGVNQRLAADLNLQPADFVGQPLDFLQAAGPLLDFVRGFVRSDRAQESRMFQTDFGGRKKEAWLLLVGQKYHDGSAAVIVSIDITELKEAEAQLAAQKQRMEASARLAALGQMAAGLAHEINNPLTVLMAHASMLQKLSEHSPVETERLQTSLGKMLNMLSHIAAIVSSCRRYAQGDLEEPRRTPLRGMIADAAEICAGRIKTCGARLELPEISADLMLTCRPVQLSQVLVNLLANAADAVAHLPQRWISVAVRETDQTIELCVTDSGRGLPPQAAARIFEPFYTTKGENGTGLGLNICRGIITEHGGTLAVDAGCANTCFKVVLPR